MYLAAPARDWTETAMYEKSRRKWKKPTTFECSKAIGSLWVCFYSWSMLISSMTAAISSSEVRREGAKPQRYDLEKTRAALSVTP